MTPKILLPQTFPLHTSTECRCHETKDMELELVPEIRTPTAVARMRMGVRLGPVAIHV